MIFIKTLNEFNESNKRSDSEIHDMILYLNYIKKSLPEFNYFGENNHEMYDYMIDTLEGIDVDIDELSHEMISNIDDINYWKKGKIETSELFDDYEKIINEIKNPIQLKGKPCKECPFLKTAIKGYLGPHSLDDIRDIVRTGVDFQCHMSLETTKPHTCVGYIHYLNNTANLSRNKEVADKQKDIKDSKFRKDCLGFDFNSHHTL